MQESISRHENNIFPAPTEYFAINLRTGVLPAYGQGTTGSGL
jgi:hypothetical protein